MYSIITVLVTNKLYIMYAKARNLYFFEHVIVIATRYCTLLDSEYT